MKGSLRRLIGSVLSAAAGSTVLATNCIVEEDATKGIGFCVPPIIDCVDTVVDTDGSDSACPVDNPDCGDNPAEED